MQKKIIALAVAGLASTAAFAQTNVTIYGVADAAVVYQNVNGGNSGQAGAVDAGHGRDSLLIQSGQLAGSRIGFKGTEDLGNGLKAIFVLEYALALDANTGVGAGVSNLTARQQLVGLSSKAGEVTLGRLYAPGYATLSMDAFAASPGLSSTSAAQALVGATIDGSSGSRWNNAVSYRSPVVAGFSGQVIYSAGETANEFSRNEGYGIGLDYAAGPVAVKYVFQHASGNMVTGPAATTFAALEGGVAPAAAATNGGASDEHFIGASWDFKVVKLLGSAQLVDRGGKDNSIGFNTAVAGNNANGSNRTYTGQAANGEVYTIGAVVPVGKGNIHAAFAHANRDGINTSSYRGQTQSTSIGYTHGLSKRTTLYTGLRYTDSDVRNAGAATTVVAGGINHTF